MSTYFTSDQHFFHNNIIKLANRPFTDLYTMHQTMIQNFQSIVTDQDTIYWVGDVVWNFQKLPDLLAKCPGHHILIVGNHDKCFKETYAGTPGKYTEFYLRAGFSEIYTNTVIDIAGQLVNLSHFPYRNDNPEPEYDDRYRDMRPVDDGNWLIHRHIHSKGLYNHKMINVSVEMHNYTPIHIDQIAQHIKDNPNGIS